MRLVALGSAVSLTVLWMAAHTLSAADKKLPVDYVKQIKPIFVKHCNECHSVEKDQSGFRLDVGALLLKGGDRGDAIVPGKSGKSLLFQVLIGEGDASPMPMDKSPLKKAEIALIKMWIDQGAKLPKEELNATKFRKKSDHWAFQPIKSPEIPSFKLVKEKWVRSPIDAFVLTRLEQEGLSPSPEADQMTLIRRLSLDLRGVLPSPEEVEKYIADKKPGAYERLVNRFLASPQYGERWARHWLDSARYADSNGFTIDGPRVIWPYRDWVIKAINADMPFDQFTIEQIAGDLLPDATRDQIVATGFHRNTLINQEGGTDKEQFRVEAVVDRLNTTGAVFLGLTVGCGQCHAHKYDPISQREFYQMYAFFNQTDDINSVSPTIALPTPKQAEEQMKIKTDLATVQKTLKGHDAEIAKGQPAWEKAMLAIPMSKWVALDPKEFVSAENAVINKLDGNALIVGGNGNIPASDIYTVTTETTEEKITAVRLEALTNKGLPKNGPGLAANGSFVLSEFEVTAVPLKTTAGKDVKPVKLQLVAGISDWAQSGFPTEQAIDGNIKTGWSIGVAKGQGPVNVNREIIFVAKQPVGFPGGTRLTFKITQKHSVAKSSIGCFRLSVNGSITPEKPVIADSIHKLLELPVEKRTGEQKIQITQAYNRTDKTRKPFAAKLAVLKKREAELKAAIPTTMVMRERKKPRETHIQIRGDFLRLGAKVEPNVLEVLPPLPEGVENPTRLDFARWLVSAENPLTPRVTVNRIWQRFFGRGLVDTENDFGTQGSLPTHPKILDWLASEFVTSGWKLKDLQRLIVNSSTYRQSSRVSSELLKRDSQNNLLARQSRVRLEAETIRDVCLSASGLLSKKIGGPGVYPPQPKGINLLTQVTKQWPEAKNEDRYRRGLYIYFWRSNPYPFLMTFDAPRANVTCTRRSRSNTPLQALTLANDEAFFEFAQGLANRIFKSGPDYDEGRIRYAFRLCLSREPSGIELKRVSDFLATQRKHFKAATEEAKSVAPTNRPKEVDVVEAAAWTTVARVMLNLDEFITRE